MDLDNMSAEDARARINAYERALERMWKDQPSTETQTRFNAFRDSKHMKRIFWIKWVEEQIEQIDWCRELVCLAVTLKLQGPTR